MKNKKNNTGEENTGNRNSGNRNSGYGNSGYGNSGNRNSGNRNSGDWNSGDWNSGDWNSGNRNSGDWNSGDWNSGDRNSGDWNSGDRNSGDWNSGDWNSGDWNSGYGNSTGRETGIFNTTQGKIRCFNKKTDILYDDINHPSFCEFELNKWIPEYNMTEEEKKNDPEFYVRQGYLKTFTYKEAWVNFWRNTNEKNRQKFLDLPNFDPEIFKDITGIDVGKKTKLYSKETIENAKRILKDVGEL